MEPTAPSLARHALWRRSNDQVRGDLEDVPFFTALAIAQGGPVLELGCGAGRVLVPIALSGVAPAVGLDQSREALDGARGLFEAQRELQLRSRAVVLKHRPNAAFPPLPESILLMQGDATAFRMPCLSLHVHRSHFAHLHPRRGPALLLPLLPLPHRGGGLLAFSDYGRPDVDGPLADAGFDVLERYGWFDLRPWSSSAWHTVVIARPRWPDGTSHP